MIKHASPKEAHEMMQREGHVYLDVRTTEEFAAGHPPSALNIPVVDFDSSSGQMIANDDFMRVVQRHISENDRVLVGCKSGGRSLMAAQMMEASGFTDVTNVTGGFVGKSDEAGNLIEPGWSVLNLPVEEGGDDAYAELKEKAGV